MLIPVAAIDLPPGRREAVPRKVDELALSIALLGQLAPVIVFPNPEVPGRFEVVAGKHRLLAFKKLERPEIEATITDADAVHRELIEISENVHRCELSGAERDRALQRYAALYGMLHPELASAVAGRRTANLKVGARAPEGTTAAPGRVPAPAEAVADRFGVGVATARRAIRRGEAFTDDERAALDALDLPLEQLDRVAAIADPADRVQVVTLLAMNMDLDDALVEVLGDRADGPVPAPEPEAEDPADGDDGSPARTPEQEREEWLRSLPIRGRVDRARFDADAGLYRDLQPIRAEVERAIGWAALKARLGRGEAAGGVYLRRLARFLDAPHPRQWVVCHACSRGMTAAGACGRCQGGGYLIG